MSETTNPAPAPVAIAKKPRNPVERAIVWGGIVVLLSLVGTELIGYWAQRTALATITKKLQAGDDVGAALKAADVKAIVGRNPVHVENVTEKNLSINAKRMEIYHWFTLSPIQKRELYVYYGMGDENDAEVINVTTGEDTDTYKHAKPPESK
jgi:hypothetical protein